MSKNQTPDTRERLLAYVGTLRTTLLVNPEAEPLALVKLFKVRPRIVPDLQSLGVIHCESGHVRWESKATDAEIVDQVIEFRRREERPQPGLLDATEFERVWKALGELVGKNESLAGSFDALRVHVDELSKRPAIDAETLQLLNLAIDDKDALKNRVEELERLVGIILRAEVSRPRKTPEEMQKTPEVVLESASRLLAVERPMVKFRRHKVLILGLYPRDHRHVQDQAALALGEAHSERVELSFNCPDDPIPKYRADISAIVYTTDAERRIRALNWGSRTPRIHTGTGIKGVAEAVATFVRKNPELI